MQILREKKKKKKGGKIAVLELQRKTKTNLPCQKVEVCTLLIILKETYKVISALRFLELEILKNRIKGK
ncbi:hypothetical protein PP707_00900 [Acetobacter pasteurianus]|nr:hypothetical protein [Acetobacter pasteurianus]